MLIDLHDAWVAMLLEALIVLLAEAQALRWRATDRAGTARPMLFDVAAPTDARQVLARAVQMVAILVVHVPRIRRSTTRTRPRRNQFSAVMMCRCPRRSGRGAIVESGRHALLIAKFPATEMQQGLQGSTWNTLPLQQHPAMLAVLYRGRFERHRHG